jgi:hypothetical protein
MFWTANLVIKLRGNDIVTDPTPFQANTPKKAKAVRFQDTNETPGDLCSMSFTSWE